MVDRCIVICTGNSHNRIYEDLSRVRHMSIMEQVILLHTMCSEPKATNALATADDRVCLVYR